MWWWVLAIQDGFLGIAFYTVGSTGMRHPCPQGSEVGQEMLCFCFREVIRFKEFCKNNWWNLLPYLGG